MAPDMDSGPYHGRILRRISANTMAHDKKRATHVKHIDHLVRPLQLKFMLQYSLTTVLSRIVASGFISIRVHFFQTSTRRLKSFHQMLTTT